MENTIKIKKNYWKPKIWKIKSFSNVAAAAIMCSWTKQSLMKYDMNDIFCYTYARLLRAFVK